MREREMNHGGVIRGHTCLRISELVVVSSIEFISKMCLAPSADPPQKSSASLANSAASAQHENVSVGRAL